MAGRPPRPRGCPRPSRRHHGLACRRPTRRRRGTGRAPACCAPSASPTRCGAPGPGRRRRARAAARSGWGSPELATTTCSPRSRSCASSSAAPSVALISGISRSKCSAWRRRTSSPTPCSAESPARWATTRSPPMPMARWMRWLGTSTPTSRKAAFQAMVRAYTLSTSVPSTSRTTVSMVTVPSRSGLRLWHGSPPEETPEGGIRPVPQPLECPGQTRARELQDTPAGSRPAGRSRRSAAPARVRATRSRRPTSWAPYPARKRRPPGVRPRSRAAVSLQARSSSRGPRQACSKSLHSGPQASAARCPARRRRARPGGVRRAARPRLGTVEHLGEVLGVRRRGRAWPGPPDLVEPREYRQLPGLVVAEQVVHLAQRPTGARARPGAARRRGRRTPTA